MNTLGCRILNLIALTAFLLLPGVAEAQLFEPAVQYSAGVQPREVTIGDFNGDDYADMVSANYEGDNVTVWRGYGEGVFSGFTHEFSVGDGPQSIDSGDIDGDGHLDLVTADINSDTVSVLIGNGDLSFQTAISHYVGNIPNSVALDDLNGDGHPDLAVVFGQSPGSIAVMLGNGDGSFQAPVPYSTGADPYSIAIGDLDADGDPDLVTGDQTGDAAIVLLNNGNGSFQDADYFWCANGARSVDIGDLDDDGFADLVLGWVFDGGFSVMLNNGDGTFDFLDSYFTGGVGSTAAIIEDLDGDCILDVAVANSATDVVSVLLGNGDASFQSAVDYETGGGPNSVTTADLDWDYAPDLVLPNRDSDDISVLINTTDDPCIRQFETSRDYPAGNLPYDVEIGDVHGGGGIPDLITANCGSDNISVRRGLGNGTFSLFITTFPVGDCPRSVASDDFDGDSDLDLAVANTGSGTVSVLLGTGDGSFQPAVDYPVGSQPESVAIGDLDGDGNPDLAVPWFGYPSHVAVLLGNGDGSFQAPVDYPIGDQLTSVSIADLNGDGDPDLALAVWGYPGRAAVLLGNGDGTFQIADFYEAGDVPPQSIASGDLDGDGDPDLALGWESDMGLTVLLNNGDGTFGGPTVYNVHGSDVSVAISDLNLDSIPDLVVTSGSSDELAVLHGNGDGTFRDADYYRVGDGPNTVSIRDVNNDGYPDLAVANKYSDDVSVLLNTKAKHRVFVWNASGNPANSAGTIRATLQSLDYQAAKGDDLPADLSRYWAIFACLGVYSYNHQVTTGEGAMLASYLDSGGRLYMEGGDTWYFDTPTAVHPYFNIIGESDGPNTGDCGPVNGVSGTFTQGMSFSYSGDNSYMDRISPSGDAFTALRNGDPVYDNCVAHDGGTYRTIGCAFDFSGLDDGAYPNTKEELLKTYLDFLAHGIQPVDTVEAAISCNPASGTLPFATAMTVYLENIYTGFTRRISGHIDISVAGGGIISNWRSGYTNVAPGSVSISSWPQNIPAMATLVGANHFQLRAEDTTPPPYNLPPYPLAGDTDTGVCVVTGIAP